MSANNYQTHIFPTWCPGCGNFGIWGALKEAVSQQRWGADGYVAVYGVGCSGNMNDFLKAYGIHSLHGRAIPNAVGAKLANHSLPVLVIAGDGDLLGEGGNHFMHACRGNFDITVIIHNNQIYGLTTGQVSPTSLKGSKSKSTPEGIIEEPLNPVALAITQGASFVAQGFAGDIAHLTELMNKALAHRGFSVINVFQPCVTFNKLNTYKWFRQRVYKLDNSYNPSVRKEAVERAYELFDRDKIPLGVIYRKDRPTYWESIAQLKKGPLISQAQNVSLDDILDELI